MWSYQRLGRIFEKDPLIMSTTLLQNTDGGMGRLKISGRPNSQYKKTCPSQEN
jgi:hypothetical protein